MITFKGFLKTFFAVSQSAPIKKFLFTFLSLTSISTFQKSAKGVDAKGYHNDNLHHISFDHFRARPHYAVNPDKAAKLALLEEHLADAILEIILESSSTNEINLICHQHLNKYLIRYEQDATSLQGLTGVPKAIAVAENPVFTFKMIRRIFVTLINESLSLCQESNIKEIVTNIFDKMLLQPPVDEDYQDALLGILRIHFVYGFKAEQIQRGIFQSIQTNASLSFEDCLALADKAMSMKLEVLAYQWKHAAITSSSGFISLEKTWNELMSLANVKTLAELHEKLDNKIQERFGDGISFDYDFYAPCREQIKETMENEHEQECLLAGFHWDPYFAISPVKVEVLSRDPLILQFYDFVGESEMKSMKRTAAGFLRRSLVQASEGQTTYPTDQTSISTFLNKENEQNPIMNRLNKRIERIVDLEVMNDNASNLQVVMYGALGGYHDFHQDATMSPDNPIFSKESGNRIATFLMFLSDVTLGGYTAFPRLGIHAKSVKSSALFWYSIMPNSQTDYLTVYGSCPVILGNKFVANRWIMEYENMWKYPCISLQLRG